MPDYRELYFQLFRAVEDALDLLIAAQRACEELYIAASEPPLTVLPAAAGMPETGGDEADAAALTAAPPHEAGADTEKVQGGQV